ncbi:uncharacterized protein LOC113205615 [Frankliniella occidentalis]|uniref:Uncharacterized protein LOC113205615 n=1 Tax=Frankliniella occidentalis TaxID=133901 RepID=A0A9C6X6I9_FRAOC|nr:uncharacterized protein LOC113205615 [Frankliniella occidentalis]
MAFGVIQAKMPFLLVVLLALLRQKITDGKNINSFAGPFSLYAERYYMCELNRSLPWEWFIHASRFNPYKPRENQKLTGNFTARNLPADDSWWGTIILDLWANNQWKENAFVFTKKNDACTAIKVNIPGFYELFNKKRETKGRCIIKQVSTYTAGLLSSQAIVF